MARFVGTDKTEFRDNRQFRGNAFELLLAAERFLREHVPIAGRVVPEHLERVDEPLYPPLAVREALANAFATATMPSVAARSGWRSMTTDSK